MSYLFGTSDGGYVFSTDVYTPANAYEPALPEGGIVFGGSATVVVSLENLAESYIGEGGIVFSGAAIIAAGDGEAIYPSDRWTNAIRVERDYLYNRLKEQRNPFVCTEVGPVVIGDLSEGLTYKPWTFRYDPATGTISGNRIPITSASGIGKLDATFDNNGYPVIIYEKSGEIFLYYRAGGVYTLTKLDDGKQPFVCLTGWRTGIDGHIEITYFKGNTVVTRWDVDNFTYSYNTNFDIPQGVYGKIYGFGVTVDYQLEINIKLELE